MRRSAMEVKQQLLSIISEMAANPSLFAQNPATDFTRKRKLGFETLVLLLLSMGGGSLQRELLEYTGYPEPVYAARWANQAFPGLPPVCGGWQRRA